MEIFRSRRRKMADRAGAVLPVLVPVVLTVVFLGAVGRISGDTLEREQEALVRALEKGAVRTYALTGRYPLSLDELTGDYHITYDKEKFVVEYVSNASNMFPVIHVIPLKNGKGGGR